MQKATRRTSASTSPPTGKGVGRQWVETGYFRHAEADDQLTGTAVYGFTAPFARVRVRGEQRLESFKTLCGGANKSQRREAG
jgi:hypothetical protein